VHIVLGSAAVACSANALLLTKSGAVWPNILAGVARGACLSGYGTVSGVAHAQYYGRANVGAIAAHSQISLVVLSALGPLAFSVAISMLGSFRSTLLLTALFPAVLSVLDFAVLRPPTPLRGTK
jgi:hypothetical protein